MLLELLNIEGVDVCIRCGLCSWGVSLPRVGVFARNSLGDQVALEEVPKRVECEAPFLLAIGDSNPPESCLGIDVQIVGIDMMVPVWIRFAGQRGKVPAFRVWFVIA